MLGRQKYIYTAEPLAPDPSTFKVEMAIGQIKNTNSQVLIKF